MNGTEASGEWLERRVSLVNPGGLHARPCHAIVSLVLETDCDLRVANGPREVSGRSILELMTLCAPPGTELRLRASGEGAAGLLDRIAALVACGFDETA